MATVAVLELPALEIDNPFDWPEDTFALHDSQHERWSRLVFELLNPDSFPPGTWLTCFETEALAQEARDNVVAVKSYSIVQITFDKAREIAKGKNWNGVSLCLENYENLKFHHVH